MKKDSLIKLVALALVVATVATVFYALYINNRASGATPESTLVVAAKPLKPGMVLVAADLKTVAWPAGQLPKDGYQRTEQVVGGTVFDPIGEQEPVLSSRLATAKDHETGGVPAGMRAISVHVTDSTGVLALLRSGQKVDVQVVMGRGNGGDTLVRTALEDLAVFSVTPQPEQSSQGQNLPVVTLLAKPAEADLLAAADSGARVRLTLRNPLDKAAQAHGLVSLGTVVRGGQ
jgi:pilus assembly protein CpaB